MSKINTPSFGSSAGHIAYSDFFRKNSIVQQTAITQPKNLLIDTLRQMFVGDSVFPYRHDEFGYPLTPDITGSDPELEDTTKILITDAYRYEVRFFPAIVVKSNGGSYKPLSFNQNGTLKYRVDSYRDQYGALKKYKTPTHKVFAGMWDTNIEIGIYAESHSEVEELADIVSIGLQNTYWQDLRSSGLFIKSLSIGSESAEPYANDFVYSQSVSIGAISEWRVEVPVESVIEKLVFYFESTRQNNLITNGKENVDTKFEKIFELTEI